MCHLLSANEPLTHWGRDQMDAISQRTFSNPFSWMKMFEYRLKFHWNVFSEVQLTIFQRWFRYWLGAVQATSHYLNQWWLVYRRIYASLGLNELTCKLTTRGSLSVPKHYLNQCWLLVNWKLRNKFQWNLKQSTAIFICKNKFTKWEALCLSVFGICHHNLATKTLEKYQYDGRYHKILL